MTCPHCRKRIPSRAILSEAARVAGARAKHPGRKRIADRCPCGAMSRARAAKRGHKCEVAG